MAENLDLGALSEEIGTLLIPDEDPPVRPNSPQVVDLDAESAALGPIEEQDVKDRKMNRTLRVVMAGLMVVTFVPASFATLALFFLNGFGFTKLSDTALVSLQGATVAQLAAIMVIMAKYLFPQGK